jgi:Hint domain
MADQAVQSAQVFAAADFVVVNGVNRGEPLGVPDELCEGDVYRLDVGATPVRMAIRRDGGVSCLAPGSSAGLAGAPVAMLARLRMMGEEGEPADLLLLQAGAALFALPLSPLSPGADHTLLAVEPPPEEVALADLLCVSFVRGTRITLGDGRQVPIEALGPGDQVLTRDHGRQAVRWVGRVTLRAAGAFAPVVIGKGVLGNAEDLAVSQHHRLFLYQRRKAEGVPTSEVLVQARHLVDGDRVWLREGGFVDYLSLVFDRHEIVYAEGIPVESLMVCEATVTRLPEGLAAEVQARFPGLRQTQHFGTEAGREALAGLPRRR